MITWIVAFRDKATHEVVGPVWFLEGKYRPLYWAKTSCDDNCEYAIMPANGYSYDTGVPDSVLQALQWYIVELEEKAGERTNI